VFGHHSIAFPIDIQGVAQVDRQVSKFHRKPLGLPAVRLLENKRAVLVGEVDGSPAVGTSPLKIAVVSGLDARAELIADDHKRAAVFVVQDRQGHDGFSCCSPSPSPSSSPVFPCFAIIS
jgi:hypothetical protein